jgi:hypothetical protein
MLARRGMRRTRRLLLIGARADEAMSEALDIAS